MKLLGKIRRVAVLALYAATSIITLVTSSGILEIVKDPALLLVPILIHELPLASRAFLYIFVKNQ